MRKVCLGIFCSLILNLAWSCSAKDEEKLQIPDEIKTNVPKEHQARAFLGAIFSLIQTSYVENMSDEKLVELSLNNIMPALDPHSSYLSPKSFKSLLEHTNGEFGGIGTEIVMDGGFIRIISPIDDTPAFHAGLKAGDLITHINGELVQSMSSDEAVEKLRGRAGTHVRIKVKRVNKDLFTVKIKREMIKVKSVKYEIFNNIAYIRVALFDQNTVPEMRKSLENIKKNLGKKLLGIVLDLRNNPGGILEQSVGVAETFLPKDKVIVSIKSRVKDINQVMKSSYSGGIENVPLVVLINSGSASASEIVAGALQDHKRALIVGVRSFGKGSVQQVIPLTKDSGIKLTVARYLTPNNRSIQARGIDPDIEVNIAKMEPIQEDFIVREGDLYNALDKQDKPKKNLSEDEVKKEIKKVERVGLMADSKKSSKENEKDADLKLRKLSLKERLEQDIQLMHAFNMIKAWRKISFTCCGK